MNLARLTKSLLLLAIGGLLLAGCGDEDVPELEVPNGKALIEPLQQVVSDQISAGGGDPEEAGGPPVRSEGCPVIGEDGLKVLSVPAGRDLQTSEVGLVANGGPGAERVDCTFDSDEGDLPPIAGFTVGTTVLSPELFLGSADITGENAVIEGSAEGLKPASVVAIQLADARRFAWVEDGIYISFTGPRDQLDGERGFELLTALVEGVGAQLDPAPSAP